MYGPPAFQLSVRQRQQQDTGQPRARRDLREAISQLAEQAADADDLEAQVVGRRLQEFVATAPTPWLDGDEWQRIGDVYRQLGATLRGGVLLRQVIAAVGPRGEPACG